MSRHDGRILMAYLSIDFSSTNINNSTGTSPTLKSPTGSTITTLPQNISRVDVSNTAADGVLILANGAAAALAGNNCPGQSIAAIMNQNQSITLKSVLTATLSSGKLYVAFYQ